MNITHTFLMIACSALAGCSRAATIDDRVAQYEARVQTRLAPLFKAQSIPYPPSKITLLALKEEKKLELHVLGTNGLYQLIKTYPILAASGTAGPKLKEGDLQVPEGFYEIESLNPNSRYHLSLRVNYPNAEDKNHAKEEGRTHLGGDIMIHGKALSIGCIAIGDPASEELFILAAKTGIKNICIIISPIDFRLRPIKDVPLETPAWIKSLYERLKTEMDTYKSQFKPGSRI
ncbi:MAG: L,D-transpeptidase family protein [bacterium]